MGQVNTVIMGKVWSTLWVDSLQNNKNLHVHVTY